MQSDPKVTTKPTEHGEYLYDLVCALYPICRSITGEGVRQSLRLLQDVVPMEIKEVATGTKVFDWEVPKEWNIREAWVRDAQGNTVVDFAESNLHVLNYSVPIHRKMGLAELKEHLFSLEGHPDWIPYRTSYYRENWGFCLSHRQLQRLSEGEYEVRIDSTLGPGHLTYGEIVLPGESQNEVLISAHCCHPSLANDNLSGMVIAAGLARRLSAVPRRYTYRFVWVPGTIGSITWLAQHEAILPRIKHGLVLSCLGDPGRFTYKRSRQGNAEVDQAVEQVLRHSGTRFEVEDFTPFGYDERQYCSPGFNLPVGCFMRTPNGQYPEYHTSADDLKLVSAAALGESLHQLGKIIDLLEGNLTYENLHPKGEPQLGRRGLYRSVGGTANAPREAAILWMLNYSDGQHSILDIAQRSNLSSADLIVAAQALLEAELIRVLDRKS